MRPAWSRSVKFGAVAGGVSSAPLKTGFAALPQPAQHASEHEDERGASHRRSRRRRSSRAPIASAPSTKHAATGSRRGRWSRDDFPAARSRERHAVPRARVRARRARRRDERVALASCRAAAAPRSRLVRRRHARVLVEPVAVRHHDEQLVLEEVEDLLAEEARVRLRLAEEDGTAPRSSRLEITATLSGKPFFFESSSSAVISSAPPWSRRPRTARTPAA